MEIQGQKGSGRRRLCIIQKRSMNSSCIKSLISEGIEQVSSVYWLGSMSTYNH